LFILVFDFFIWHTADIDLSTRSEPWTEQELSDFRKVMQEIKAKNAARKEKAPQQKSKKQSAY
jgi:hypothetical protein